jgi:cobalt/nickel transport system permease protein
MIEELFEIERDAYKNSVIHRLDARVKIAIAFAAIIALVAVPYSTMIYTVGAIFFVFFFFLWCCSRLPLGVYAKRLLSILPLWGIIIFFQIFVKNKYYTDYTVVVSLPLGINIYAQSIEFAFILLVKFIVTVSFIILLSSTTRMPDLLEGASRMGLPAEFALALGMMIRYLFVFGYMYRRSMKHYRPNASMRSIAIFRTITVSASWATPSAPCLSARTSRGNGCIPVCSAVGTAGKVFSL